VKVDEDSKTASELPLDGLNFFSMEPEGRGWTGQIGFSLVSARPPSVPSTSVAQSAFPGAADAMAMRTVKSTIVPWPELVTWCVFS
jgi:hypothetical protein